MRLLCVMVVRTEMEIIFLEYLTIIQSVKIRTAKW